MARLPVVGGDRDNWGQVLNNYLSVEHNSDGTLKLRTDGSLSAGIADSEKGAASGVATLDGSSKLTASQLPDSVVTKPETGIDVHLSAYGATGDGVSNDTTAIQAAVDAATAMAYASAGGQVRVFLHPGRTYLVDTVHMKSNVWLDLNGATIKKRIDSGLSLIRNAGGSSADYGVYQNIRVTNGILDPNLKTVGSGIVGMLYVDGLTLDNLTVLHNLPVSGENWAFAVGGRNGRITNCRVLSGDGTFEDGIHIIHGQYWVVANNYVEAGDDALVCGTTKDNVSTNAHPDPVRYVSIVNNAVKAQKAYALTLFVDDTLTGSNFEVTDIVVDGLVGTAGVTANGGIRVLDENAAGPTTTQIKRVKISNVALKVGSTAHDDANPIAIDIDGATDVTLSNITIQVTDKTAASTGFTTCRVTKSNNVVVSNLFNDGTGKGRGFEATSSYRVTLRDSHIRCGSTNTVGAAYISQVRGFRIIDNDILDLPTLGYGVAVSSLLGTATYGEVSGNRFSALSTGGQGILASPGDFTHLIVERNDFSEVATAINSTVRTPRATTVNNGAGYNSAATSVVVASGAQVKYLDTLWCPRTGEKMKVVAVSTNTLTLVRGVDNTTAAALVDTDQLIVRAVKIGANRGLADSSDDGYRRVFAGRRQLNAIAASATPTGIPDGDTAGIPAGGSGAMSTFYFDAEAYRRPGQLLKIRVRSFVITNATAPTCNFTFALYPVSASAGASTAVSETLGTVLTGSSKVISTPASGVQTSVVTDEFDAPASGFYTPQLTLSSDMAASSAVVVGAVIEARAY